VYAWETQSWKSRAFQAAIASEIVSNNANCRGTAPKMAAVPALSVPAVLCRRDLCGMLDGLDYHLAVIVVSHAV
jgi:hypothetical protein